MFQKAGKAACFSLFLMTLNERLWTDDMNLLKLCRWILFRLSWWTTSAACSGVSVVGTSQCRHVFNGRCSVFGLQASWSSTCTLLLKLDFSTQTLSKRLLLFGKQMCQHETHGFYFLIRCFRKMTAVQFQLCLESAFSRISYFALTSTFITGFIAWSRGPPLCFGPERRGRCINLGANDQPRTSERTRAKPLLV